MKVAFAFIALAIGMEACAALFLQSLPPPKETRTQQVQASAR